MLNDVSIKPNRHDSCDVSNTKFKFDFVSGAEMVNAAVAVGQQTCKEDAMWKKIFDEDSETSPVVDLPSKSDPRDVDVLRSRLRNWLV